ncbi:2-oxo acid dehydrogenase subunit E2 [Pendulispora rubella]|uniref:Dihydrolipoamide acetyltransferase component of pyruvate dehydrogenase complex n=1 Tax=Pendulispora rubella TaxID=2741070 RepID=A0ABZ2LJ03_9BACT
MGTLYRLPDLGEGISRASIVNWYVREGERIEPEAPMLAVLTDKATVDIPAPCGGVVLRIFAAPEEVVTVGRVLVDIGPENPESDARCHETVRPPSREGDGYAGLLSSFPPAPPPPSVSLHPQAMSFVPPKGSHQRIPLSGARRAAAEHLAFAQRIPSVTVVEEADFTMLDRIQQASGVGYLPFLIQAVIASFGETPQANAIFDEGGLELLAYDDVHVGVAVQTDDALLVPVLADAQKLTLDELEERLLSLAADAHERRLRPADLAGATFTVTFAGHGGGLLATPLLNAPQVAILALNRPTRRPTVVHDELTVRNMAYLALTFDHRALDGRAAGKFLRDVRDRLSDPLRAISAGDFR